MNGIFTHLPSPRLLVRPSLKRL